MDTSTPAETKAPYRETAVNTLAVIGFIALIMLGVWAAIYSARFVPSAANRLGGAAVYLGSLFKPTTEPTGGLAVVPGPSPVSSPASTTISFGGDTTATSTATTTSPRVHPTTSSPTNVGPGPKTYTTVPVSGGSAVPVLYGQADLQVLISDIGYLENASTDSFISATKVPSGKRPAVKFNVRNAGTNATGVWNFEATIPTRSSFTYHSDTQQSLNPGESIDYTLGFDRASSGEKQTVTITVNPNNTVSESNKTNNQIFTNLTIQ